MRNTMWARLLAAIVASSLLLLGCSSKPNTVAKAPGAQEKPTLTIPESFTDKKAETEFSMKAVLDGYYAEMKPVLEQSITSAPSAKSYELLGTVRFNLNEYAAAIEAWSKAAELKPELAAEMHNNIGNALRLANKMAEARDAYGTALTLNPGLGTAAINLADLLRTEGKLQEAIAVLEKANASGPNMADVASQLQHYKELAEQTSNG